MWQRAWRTRAPSACSPEPAPQARPGTAPGTTARRWWPGPATERGRQGVSSGSPCCCSDGTAALRAASQGVDPPPKCPSVPPPPQGSPAGPAAARACMFRRKIIEIPAIYIYPAPSMRLVVSSLALCGVSSAYQATTARPGALANQVTMMAKSKARPRSLTQPAAAPRLPGLRPSCSHRAALVHRSRRCSMRLMGSRATLERRTASIRSACPTPSTWCASAPPAQRTRDAILGVSAVHCALCRGSWVVPPVRPTRGDRSIGLHPPIPEAVPRCRGGGGVGRPSCDRACAASTGSYGA